MKETTELIIDTLDEYKIDLTYEAMLYLERLPIDELAKNIQTIIDASLQQRRLMILGE